MTKFVAVAIAVAFTIIFSANAMAEGWKIGNWELSTKAPILKTVSLEAGWGTPAAPVVVVAPVAPRAPVACNGTVRVELIQHAVRPAAYSGRGGRWFLGKLIMANRQARAEARAEARAHVRTASGHS